MWSMIQSALQAILDAFKGLSKKPEPEEVPIPVDTKAADKLLNPGKKE